MGTCPAEIKYRGRGFYPVHRMCGTTQYVRLSHESTNTYSSATFMYSSASMTIEAYAPWRKKTGWTKRVHENNSSSMYQNSSAAHASGLHSMAQFVHEIPSEAIQYAPPLSAYSADHCGLSVASAEYNRALQMMSFTGVLDVPVISPQALKRLDALRRIRAAGHDTLAPIGIRKTMRELDEEARLAEEDDDALGGHAENLNAVGTSHADDPHSGGNGTLSSAANVSAHDVPSLPDNLFLEADLDAQVPDADASDTSDNELPSRSNSNTPDAFMAEDVEYQNDHSLFHDSAVGHGSLSDSHASFSTHSVLSAPSAATVPTTLVTQTHNSRLCDDSDVDMTLE